MGESKWIMLWGMVAMLADNLAIALDMSVITLSRQSMAWKTRVKEAFSQGVHIMDPSGVRGRSRVGWGCIIVSFVGIVIVLCLHCWSL